MKFRNMLVAFFATLALVVAIAPFNFTTADAEAMRGCRGKVQARADTWANDFVWSHPSFPRALPETEKTRGTITSVYNFCPNKSRVAKIKPFKNVYCWTHLSSMSSGDKFWFDGMVFDFRASDDNTDIEPWARTVGDDGTVQNCRGVEFSRDTKKWLSMGDSPHWVGYGRIKRNNLPDPDWKRFTFLGDGQKYYHPDQDPALGGWHR